MLSLTRIIVLLIGLLWEGTFCSKSHLSTEKVDLSKTPTMSLVQ